MGVQTYSRIALAVEQLETALDLFLDHNSYAPAITLAGAAEEVLGRELTGRGEQPVLEWQFDQRALVHSKLHKGPLVKKDFVRTENRVRDALKHFHDLADSTITVDLQEAACWMIVRACENARRLGVDVARFDAFDDWFYTHVVGVGIPYSIE
jgi:hypothetical protein